MAERRRTPTVPRQRFTFRPQLEALEDRWMPSILTVTSAADSWWSVVPGSLRYEIAAAQNGDTIVFSNSLKSQTITLSGEELYINKSLTIQGLGANYLAISGWGQSRVFEVPAWNLFGQRPQVTLSGMTIENGDGVAMAADGCAAGGGANSFDGGGILNYGTLTITGCTVFQNFAGYGCGLGNGGGIANELGGTMTITGCTVSQNHAGYLQRAGNGGGIANELGGTMTISGCTVSENFAGNGNSYPGTGGGGIYSDGTMTLSGSTVTKNSLYGGYLGGGIFNDVSGVLTILDSTVNHNHNYYGPDLYNLGKWTADSSSTIGSVW